MTEYKNITPIYNALGEEMVNNLPILDLKGRRNFTEYIDFIIPDEMPYNIMKGIDYYNRPFITFKFYVCNKNDSTDSYCTVGTFFQRYTNDIYDLAFGTCGQLGLLYDRSRINKSDYKLLEERIKLLINNVNIYDITFNDNLEDDKFWLYGNGNNIITLQPIA
jgi:hypothetical protein